MLVKYILTILIFAFIAAGGIYFWHKNFSDNISTETSGNSTSTTQTYRSERGGFEFGYDPAIVTVASESQDQHWRNESADPGTLWAMAVLPREFEPKTNFSEARLIVGSSLNSVSLNNCMKEENGMQKIGTETMNGTNFTVFKGGGAGAGNFYDVTGYRTMRAGQCYSVEFMIHTTNIGNYPPEMGIKEFDKGKVLDVLGGMLQSFKFL